MAFHRYLGVTFICTVAFHRLALDRRGNILGGIIGIHQSILEVLSQTCKGTLRILDIERSRHVEDDSVDLIKTCNKLMKINFFSLVSV